MIYTASSLSLAVLEYFVHLPAAMRQRDRLPDLIAVALDLRDDAVETLTLSGTLSLQDTRATGDNWISSRRSLGLSVPSRLIPLERNLLLNATHLLIGQVSVALQLPFQFDDWLGI